MIIPFDSASVWTARAKSPDLHRCNYHRSAVVASAKGQATD